MNYCTLITNYDKEQEIIHFLIDFCENEKINNMLIQFRYIMKEQAARDYYISFNPDNYTLFAVQGVHPDWAKNVNMTVFLAEMEKSFNLLNKNLTPAMKRLTLENIKDLSPEYTVIVYQAKNSTAEPKPLMLMISQYFGSLIEGNEPVMHYGFIDLTNPVSPYMFYRDNSMEMSIGAAIEGGMEVYAAKSINRIYFADTIPAPITKKETLVRGNDTISSVLEEYVMNLLRRHTDYLLSELAITQFPKETIKKVTEKFIKEL